MFNPMSGRPYPITQSWLDLIADSMEDLELDAASLAKRARIQPEVVQRVLSGELRESPAVPYLSVAVKRRPPKHPADADQLHDGEAILSWNYTTVVQFEQRAAKRIAAEQRAARGNTTVDVVEPEAPKLPPQTRDIETLAELVADVCQREGYRDHLATILVRMADDPAFIEELYDAQSHREELEAECATLRKRVDELQSSPVTLAPSEPLTEEALAAWLRRLGDERAERIQQQTEKGDDGRVRYHGRTRQGRLTVLEDALTDIDLALHSIMRARDGLEFLQRHGDEIVKLKRYELFCTALGHSDHAVRFIEEMLEKNSFKRISLDFDDGDILAAAEKQAEVAA